ncbi:MAG TPA: hypothetical protein VHR66_32960 [Gemmataceae bacterium]|jgi:hypothetical protein|nr:hypothetical protein [Gemmataceae bacterium]
MTDAELDRLEQLCDMATGGPWNIGRNLDGCRGLSLVGPTFVTICNIEEDKPVDFDDPTLVQIGADFAFMSAARSALPALLAEVRRLRADQPFVVG